MKCENWSNKVNNFVVRKLKSFKLNGQQQVLSTMPAMPKEKTSPIPLTECNYAEIKMKEHLCGTSKQSVTVSGSIQRNKIPDNILTDCNNTTQLTQRGLHHQHQHQHQHSYLYQNQNQNQNHQQQQNQQPTQQQIKSDMMTKLYSSSSCNNICLMNGSSNSIRSTTSSSTSAASSINDAMTMTMTMTITGQTSNNPSLHNGSVKNIYNNSKNDLHNKNLNNGIISSGSCGSSYYCNKNRTTISSSSSSSSSTPSAPITEKQTNQRIINNLSSSSSSSSSSSATTMTMTTASSRVRSSSISSPSSTATNINNSTTSTKPNSLSSTPSVATTTTTITAAPGTRITNPAVAAAAATGMPAKKSAKDYVFGKIIGEGSFSTVCLARDIHTNREYAIKICYKPHILREKKQEYVRREREIMHIMNNISGFVNLSCTFQDYRNLYFVMTLAKNGDLLPYINKVGSFDLDCTRHYAAELVLAIENMHKRGVIHRDLKPENILLDENMHSLIADFGSAKMFDVNREKEMMLSPAMTTATATATMPTTMMTAAAAAAGKTLRTTETDSSPVNGRDRSRGSSGGSGGSGGGYADSNRKQDNNVNAANVDDNDDDDDDDYDSPRPIRKRRGSFVGTAQYVSPEVLQGEIVTRSADLWALGCIIYQMISGLPPFRGGSDYLIFREIMNLNLIFPEGFDKNAEDLVRNLLKLNPNERLGANDPPIGKYESIRSHPFFNGIEWDKIRQNPPPQIYPYLPGVSKDEELRSHYRVPDNLEPGLDDKQLTRLLGLELGTLTTTATTTTPATTTIAAVTRKESLLSVSSSLEKKAEPKTFKDNLNLSENEKQKRLEAQKSDKWHQFADNEVILKKGFVNKRKGLFARKRMLLLTTGPRLIYIDPVQMIKKGEIPWSPALRVEPKNFKIFFVHTPNRTYYLEDPEGYALEWVNAIEDVRQKTFGDKS